MPRREGHGLELPVAVALAGIVACAGAVGESTAVPAPQPGLPPHAPGVAVDPVLPTPKPAWSGSTERGVVVLAEPVDTRAARRVVDAFFAAVVGEALDDLSQLCEPSAHARVSARSPARSGLVTFWQKRFERLDYRSLATEVFYRSSEMEVHTAGDAAALGAMRALPRVPTEAEVLIRTPIVGLATPRLFGNDLVFLLRPGAAGYKIAELYEDFRLP